MALSTRFGAGWLALAMLILSSSTAQAVGFRLPEISIAGLSLSNAVVADSQTPGALAYNPAAMSFHDANILSAGVMNVHPEPKVIPDGGSRTDSEGQENILVPNFYYMHRISDSLTTGIAINAPFGLETKWADETFPAFAGPVDGLEPEHSKLKMANINPNLAYQINDNTSVAVGINYFLIKELVFNTQGIEVEGDGSGIGWNLGLMHQQGDWGFGLAYRTRIDADVDGTVDATEIGSTRSDASAVLNFPSMLQLGVRYQANDKLAVEFDIERSGWSSFDVIEIEHSSVGLASPITSVNEWNDTTAYRLGASYQLTHETQLRFGITRENSSSDGDYMSARMPTNDITTLSTGFAHTRDNITIEAGYMLVMFDDLKQDAPTGSYFAGLPGNSDPNGTDAYNGKYETTAHLVGIGLTMRF